VRAFRVYRCGLATERPRSDYHGLLGAIAYAKSVLSGFESSVLSAAGCVKDVRPTPHGPPTPVTAPHQSIAVPPRQKQSVIMYLLTRTRHPIYGELLAYLPQEQVAASAPSSRACRLLRHPAGTVPEAFFPKLLYPGNQSLETASALTW
jgi:hypothetical protein